MPVREWDLQKRRPSAREGVENTHAVPRLGLFWMNFIGRDQFHTFRMGPVTNKLYNNNILYLVRPSYKTPTLRQRQCPAGEDWTQLPLPPKKGSRRCVSPGWMRTWQSFLCKNFPQSSLLKTDGWRRPASAFCLSSVYDGEVCEGC